MGWGDRPAAVVLIGADDPHVITATGLQNNPPWERHPLLDRAAASLHNGGFARRRRPALVTDCDYMPGPAPYGCRMLARSSRCLRFRDIHGISAYVARGTTHGRRSGPGLSRWLVCGGEQPWPRRSPVMPAVRR